MRPVRSLGILALVAAGACTDIVQPPLDQQPQFAMGGANKVDVAFTMALTDVGSLWFKDLGRSGRAMSRDNELFFDVSGDLQGTAKLVVNANWDEGSWWGTDIGRASVWGVLTIAATDGLWAGNLVGEFVFDPAWQVWSAQLFSRINLHGPDGQKLKAICDETSAESEVLACGGEIRD
jgi:hypothetical protein